MIKVAYDAGHSLVTPGKQTPNGEKEWTFNNKVAVAFANELKKYENVSLLRTDDPTGKQDIPLKDRTNRANRWNADVYVSFHHNAYEGRWGNWTGTETYYYAGSKKGRQIADVVQKANVKAYGLRDRGLKTSNLHITRETKMPAILVEGGHMDSTIDIKKLRDDNVLRQAGILTAQAIAKHFGLKKKVAAKPKTVKIETGGLSNENLIKVVDFFRARKWYGGVVIDWRHGNPKVTSGGLNEASRKEYEKFLKDNKFWYKVL